MVLVQLCNQVERISLGFIADAFWIPKVQNRILPAAKNGALIDCREEAGIGEAGARWGARRGRGPYPSTSLRMETFARIGQMSKIEGFEGFA